MSPSTAGQQAGEARSASRPMASRTIPVVAAVFAALEGYDLACYGVTVPSLLGDGAIRADKAAAGTVGSLVAAGMLIGAAAAAATTRRFGSRRLMFSGATLFSIGMLVCALAPTFWIFGAARLVVGLGLGVVLPTVTAYVADLSAPGHRNRDIGIMMSGYAVGALLAPLLGAALLPDSSWRWIYVVGAAPAALLIPFAVRTLPESPVSVPTDSPPSRRTELLGLGPLLAPGARAVTLLFWAISFCGLLLVFGISTWLPTIMQAAGYSLGSALLQTSAMWIGAGVGMAAGGRAADAMGIKPVVAAAFLAGSASLLLMSTRPALGVLFSLMFVSGLGLIGSQSLTNSFIVGYYPDELRGRGIGWALAVGRFGAITGPAMGAAILISGLSVQWNFYLFAAPGVLGAALAALVPAVRSRARHVEASPESGSVHSDP